MKSLASRPSPSPLDSRTHRCSCCPAPERSRYLELSVIILRRSTVADGIIHRIETWNSGVRGFNFSNRRWLQGRMVERKRNARKRTGKGVFLAVANRDALPKRNERRSCSRDRLVRSGEAQLHAEKRNRSTLFINLFSLSLMLIRR